MYMRLCIVAADEHMLCILKARFHLALGELGAQAALHLWLLMLTVLSQSPAWKSSEIHRLNSKLQSDPKYILRHMRCGPGAL